jgi:hypothetical protein
MSTLGKRFRRGSRSNNARRCDTVNVGIRRRLRAHLTQFLHNSQRHLLVCVGMFFGTLRSQHSVDLRSLGSGDRCLHGTSQFSFRLQPVVKVVAMLASTLAEYFECSPCDITVSQASCLGERRSTRFGGRHRDHIGACLSPLLRHHVLLHDQSSHHRSASMTTRGVGSVVARDRPTIEAVRCHVGAPLSGGRIPSTASIAGWCRPQRFGPLLETE